MARNSCLIRGCRCIIVVTGLQPKQGVASANKNTITLQNMPPLPFKPLHVYHVGAWGRGCSNVIWQFLHPAMSNNKAVLKLPCSYGQARAQNVAHTLQAACVEAAILATSRLASRM